MMTEDVSQEPPLKKQKLKGEDVEMKLEDYPEADLAGSDYQDDDVKSIVSLTHDTHDAEDDYDDEDLIEPDWDPDECRYNGSDEAQESYPDCAAYCQAFLKCDEIVEQVLKQFPSLALAAEHDSRLEYLRDVAEDAKKLKSPESLIIAFLGNAGKGKTSTQNSLLDKNIADTASMGSACTNVVTAFQQPFPWQQRAYAAEIEWHSKDRMHFLIEELVKHYKRYAFEYDPDWTSEERVEAKKEHNSAIELFRTIFCDRKEMATTSALRNWFKQTHSQSRREIIDQIVEWARNIVRTQAASEADSCYESSSASDLRRMLLPFMAQRNLKRGAAQTPSYWPLVSAVNIGLKDTRLVESMTLSDLPGRSVQNSLHAITIDQYLHKVDGAWIFTDMGRVLDDVSLYEMLQEVFEKYPPKDAPNIAVVCTHSDKDVDDKLMRSLAAAKGVDLRECVSASKKQKTTQKELEALRKNKNTNHNLKNPQSYQEKLEELESTLTELSTKIYNLLVVARNKYITNALKEKYSDLVPKGTTLNVFCVSNSEYHKFKYQKDANSIDLNVAATGIPQLRSFGLSRSAPNIEEAKISNANRARWLTSSARMWTQNTAVKDPEKLLEIAKRPQAQLEPTIKEYFSTILKSAQNDLIGVLENSIIHFQREARLKHSRWDPTKQGGGKKRWAWGTYIAWCRKNGTHKTKKIPQLSWNQEFLDLVKERAKPAWPVLRQSCKKKSDHLNSDMGKLLDDVLKSVAGTLPPGVQAFHNSTASQRHALKAILQEERNRQQRFLSIIQDRTVRQSTQAFFHQAMAKTYEECQKNKGKGCAKKMLSIMSERLEQTGPKNPFDQLLRFVTLAFKHEAEEVQPKLVEKVLTVFQNIHKGLQIMLSTKDADRSTSIELQEAENQLNQWLEHAEPRVAKLWEEMDVESGGILS